MDLVGYSAFFPTKRGFQMNVTRRSDVLQERGIEAVSTTLDAVSQGCTIESLGMSGLVQSKRQPCAFYTEFARVGDVAAAEPPRCRDGSGAHARTGHVAVWTGTRALIWGGTRGGMFSHADTAMDGLIFDPGVERWSRVGTPTLPPFTPEVGVWTGTELIVFGSKIRPNYRVVGAAYDPDRSSWRVLEFPYKGWNGFEGTWTGRELILWGGPDHSRRPHRRGAVYDPGSGAWSRTSPAPIGGRWSHSVVWTGTEMIVWGGTDAHTDLADGAAYDPTGDSWRRIAPAPISSRQWFPITWTGTEVVVWGGSSHSSNERDGAAYDPAANTWRMLPPAPIRGRHYHSATWTGTELVIFGGYNYRRTFRDGAAYQPVSDSWRRISRAPLAARCCHSAVWTGAELFVFGGSPDLGHMALGDAALYDPGMNRWRRVVPDVETD
jgi:N-acetylneuraminic acid mutarotase